MKTKALRITLAFLFLGLCVILHSQPNNRDLTEIIIGDGAGETCELPFNSCTGGWAYTEIIYPGEAIGMPCVIHSISFDISEQPSYWNGSYQEIMDLYCYGLTIFLGTTNRSNHTTTTEWMPDVDMKVVKQYSWAQYLGTETGWITFYLDEPFLYEDNNLVVGILNYGYYFNTNSLIPMTVSSTSSNGASLRIANVGWLPSDSSFEGELFDLYPNIKIGAVTEPSLLSIPDVIDLGYCPSGYWMEPLNATLINEGIPSTISSVSCSNDFFILGPIDLPYAFAELDTIPYSVAHGAGENTQTGVLEFVYGDNKTADVSLSATAYTPVGPDVWELATVVNTFPYSTTISNNMAVYNNYHLPGTISDGNDVVFKMSFDSDVLLTAEVTSGEDGKVALYAEDFNGKGGPSVHNSIAMPSVYAGTYYLVASSTSEEFTVSINAETIPTPVMVQTPFPSDQSNWYGGNTVSLRWELGDYTREHQLLFGETNPPTEVLVDWTNELSETCSVTTEDAKTYYWCVNERNSSGTTEGPIWTFSTYKGITPSADNIIYVKPTGAGVKNGSSWDNAASNLQVAIDAAAAFEENRPDIWVAKGTYLANGTYEEIDGHACVFHSYNDVKLFGSLNGDETSDYDMSLRDLDANATILDAESACYVVASQGATWDGFVIQHGGEGCMLINPTDYALNTIKNCKVLYSLGNGIYDVIGDLKLYDSQISYHSNNGIFMYYYQWNNLVERCVISYNTNNGIYGCGNVINSSITNNGNGVIVYAGGGNLIGCVVANNNGTGTDFEMIASCSIVNNGTGIGQIYGGSIFIANSIIWGNSVQFPFQDNPYYWSSSNIYISNNAIQGGAEGVDGKNGVYPCINLSSPMSSNGIQPCFVNPTQGIGAAYSGGDWSLLPNSPCINMGAFGIETNIEYDIAGNPRTQQGRIDIGALESPYEKPVIQYPIHPDTDSIIYVKADGQGDGSSWESATSDLYQAMETAILYEPVATIWVAEGTYPVMNYPFQVKQGLKMYGGFEGNEPADYDLALRDFSTHASILDASNAMRVLNQSDTLSIEFAAVIDGFTLRNGSADKGAGAYLLKNMTLSHCTVENNAASGDNIGLGGGIYADESVIKDCFVVNNTANQGGGVYALNSNIVQSLIGNNEAESGGGVFAQKSDILQCDIVRNQGDGLCVFAENYNNYVHLDNSIVWGNEGHNIHGLSSFAQNNTFMSHCAVEGLQNTENGNFPLSSDNEGAFGPRFAEPTIEAGNTEMEGDWQLQEQSPCIDAGLNTIAGMVMPSNDILYSERIQNGKIDMGAFESPFEAQCLQMDIREVCIRSGESYDFYGTSLNEAGTYENWWTEGECDSLVMLHLHVADIVYVSEEGSGNMDGSSWDNALDGNTQQSDGYTKLAHRIAESGSNTEFWLTDGLYLPCGDQDNTKSFTLNEGVRIYGGFAGTENAISERDPEHEPTVFSGELQADNDSTNNTECLFVTAVPTSIWDVAAVFDGITLTQGYASTHQGAALRVNENTKVTINNCEVVGNQEGAVCNWGDLVLIGSNLSNNNTNTLPEYFSWAGPDYAGHYYNCSGAISNMEGASTVISSCSINSNYSVCNGALFNHGMMTIVDSEFDDNTADCYAVALSPGKMKIHNTLFNNNRAEGRIGVLYVWDSLKMVNCTISNNHSNYYAATHFPDPGSSSSFAGYRTSGIQVLGCCYVSGCSFTNNNANTCQGGALSVMGTATIEDCIFTGNKGVTPWKDPNDPQGGIVIIAVSSGTDGAALYVSGEANVSRCEFNLNSGYMGNTIGVDGSLNMEKCKITEGESTIMSTGAIKVTQGGELSINNSLIANNSSPAILQEEGVNTYLENTTIVNSGSTAFVFQSKWENYNPSWILMDNCIISGYPELMRVDSIGVSNAIYGIDGTLIATNSLFNPGVDNTGERSMRDGDGNLYDVDPMFVNPTTVLGIDENLSALDADWRLQAESPCINAGSAAALDLEPTALDLGGELRVKNCEIDMGAYEYGEMIWDTITDSHCEGEPYAGNGFDLPAMMPGDYVFQRTGDCADNTLHTLLLHVNPITYSTLFVESEGTFELNGETYTESGIYTQTLPNQYGCDSIITLHLQMMATQAVTLTEGWNWWAPTVETSVEAVQAALQGKVSQILSQEGEADGYIYPGEMLKIETNETCTLSVTGIPAGSVTVSIAPGPNWFGFVGTEKTVAAAFDNFTASAGDKVISQDEGFAVYENGAWSGTLGTLQPSKGYVYISNDSEPKTLVIGE